MAKTTRKTGTGSASKDAGDTVKTPKKKVTAKKKVVAKKKTAAKKKAAAKKATVKKAAARKTAVKKTAPTRRPAVRQLTAAQRHAMIAEAAYLRGESQGFLSDEREDWLLAEAEVDARLAKAGIEVNG